MLRERKIPMQVGLNTINPAFGDLRRCGLVIPRLNMSWSHSKATPRRAVLNNFGAAGSNASLLLEEWVECSVQFNKPQQPLERSAYVFTFSTRSERALNSATSRYLHFLKKENPQPRLEDVCYTASARRHRYDHRIAIACRSMADLHTKLQQCTVTASKPAKPVSATVFVFTGQGAVYLGMGRELMGTCALFRGIIMDCEHIIQGLGLAFPSILRYILRENQAETETLTDMEQIVASQCACVALEYALARTFISWGIVPDYVMGHRYVRT